MTLGFLVKPAPHGFPARVHALIEEQYFTGFDVADVFGLPFAAQVLALGQLVGVRRLRAIEPFDDPEQDVLYVTYTNFDLSYEILYIGEIPNLLPTEMRTRSSETPAVASSSGASEKISCAIDSTERSA